VEDWQWQGLKSWKWKFYLENEKEIMATFIEVQFFFFKSDELVLEEAVSRDRRLRNKVEQIERLLKPAI